MATITISTVANLSTGVADTRAISLDATGDEWIYVPGGTTGSSVTDQIQRFNPETYATEIYMTLPESNGWQVADRYNNYMYTLGGNNTRDVYEIDVDSQSITTLGSISPWSTDHMGLITSGGEFLYWGGDDGNGAGGDGTNNYWTHIRSFDISTGNDTEVGTMSKHIQDGGAVEFDGSYYNIGGIDYESGSSNVITGVFKVTSSGSWTKAADLTLNGSTFPLARVRPAATRNYVYTFGGLDGSENYRDEIIRWDPNDGWTGEQIGTISTPLQDTQMAFVESNANVYQLSGASSSGRVTDVWEIEIADLSEFIFEEGKSAFTGNAIQGFAYQGVDGEEQLLSDEGNSSFSYVEDSPIERRT